MKDKKHTQPKFKVNDRVICTGGIHHRFRGFPVTVEDVHHNPETNEWDYLLRHEKLSKHSIPWVEEKHIKPIISKPVEGKTP